jgi:hypothetical protein
MSVIIIQRRRHLNPVRYLIRNRATIKWFGFREKDMDSPKAGLSSHPRRGMFDTPPKTATLFLFGLVGFVNG